LRVLQAPLIVLLLLAKPDWRFGEGVLFQAAIRICVLRKRDGMLGLGCFFEGLLCEVCFVFGEGPMLSLQNPRRFIFEWKLAQTAELNH